MRFVHQMILRRLAKPSFDYVAALSPRLQSYYARTVGVLLAGPNRFRSFLSSSRRRLIATRSGFLPVNASTAALEAWNHSELIIAVDGIKPEPVNVAIKDSLVVLRGSVGVCVGVTSKTAGTAAGEN